MTFPSPSSSAICFDSVPQTLNPGWMQSVSPAQRALASPHMEAQGGNPQRATRSRPNATSKPKLLAPKAKRPGWNRGRVRQWRVFTHCQTSIGAEVAHPAAQHAEDRIFLQYQDTANQLTRHTYEVCPCCIKHQRSSHDRVSHRHRLPDSLNLSERTKQVRHHHPGNEKMPDE